jgi:hypothetical protein
MNKLNFNDYKIFKILVPVVALCNLNQYDFNYAANKIYPLVNDGTISQSNPNYTANDYFTQVSRHIRNNLILKYLDNLEPLYYDDFGLDQMLLSCTFVSQNCSIADFMFTYDFFYGMCYRFNSGKNLYGQDVAIRTSGQVGWRQGLQLELYAGNAQVQEKFAMVRGFRIFVFNQTNVYPIPEDIGIDVATGLSTNIGIKRTFTYHLPYPYTNCLPTDITKIDWTQNDFLQFMNDNFVKGQYYWTARGWPPGGDWTWNWTVSYSQSICVKLCFQMYLFKNCGKYHC